MIIQGHAYIYKLLSYFKFHYKLMPYSFHRLNYHLWCGFWPVPLSQRSTDRQFLSEDRRVRLTALLTWVRREIHAHSLSTTHSGKSVIFKNVLKVPNVREALRYEGEKPSRHSNPTLFLHISSEFIAAVFCH